jgi:RNA-directed DNA polymerase
VFATEPSYVSHHIFQALWRWAKRRHPNKSMGWIKNKYFKTINTRHWTFASPVKQEDGNTILLKLFDASAVSIKRHIKIKAAATPYSPEHFEHLSKRTGNKKWFNTTV